MKTRSLLLLLLLVFSSVLIAEEIPLIPRSVLLSNPEKDKPMISPGGTRIAYLAPSKEGVMNLWIASIGRQDDRRITDKSRNGIFLYTWGFSDDHLLFFEDSFGDENDHLKSVDLRSGNVRDLTPFAS